MVYTVDLAHSTWQHYYTGTEPFERGELKVSSIHPFYYEVSGNNHGQKYLRGPGVGTSAQDRIYFDPAIHKIVLFDQRGAGLSRPTASIEENTTWDLIANIERLRARLGIDKWVVFGGSWICAADGSTLALAYAQQHIDISLSGIFTLRKSELDFLYQEGTSQLFPEEWDAYIAPIPEAERGDMVKAYHERLTSSDKDIKLTAARAWSRWEMATSRLHVDQGSLQRVEKDDWAVQVFFFFPSFAAIENHYFINEGFMRQGQLLEKQSIDKIRHIPTIVVQGRYDVVCPAKSAYDLKKAWPEITLHFTHAGHSTHEPKTEKLLVEGRFAFP
ncbi:hypothetical protein BS47DRAFT_1303936 [Hydnum rufescens UP504]|uniref:Proline iminopeptidase n=1 Tax=Hydnum rufescens UP504 TaxID=1448309 RepID=A0A9P6AMG5_9AGAM|nr:hypothetical protein BS47DRAFT_1303936 [Hydnum rufescens UP504]